MGPRRHPIFVDYLIYPDGRVWSTKRQLKGNIGRPCIGKFLNQEITKYGYAIVNLYKDQKPNRKRVHRLVAETFLPNKENKQSINHKDGNKLNNDMSNLEWCTPKENTKHGIENGLMKSMYLPKVIGINSKSSKLTEEDVHWIRFFKGKAKSTELAVIFEVSQTTISQIWRRVKWKHVP